MRYKIIEIILTFFYCCRYLNIGVPGMLSVSKVYFKTKNKSFRKKFLKSFFALDCGQCVVVLFLKGRWTVIVCYPTKRALISHVIFDIVFKFMHSIKLTPLILNCRYGKKYYISVKRKI